MYIPIKNSTAFGAIQSKQWVAKFILDIAGFKNSDPIESISVLDAGCGKGVFLLEALNRSISRVLNKKSDFHRWIMNVATQFVGVEINPELCKKARYSVGELLRTKARISESQAQHLAEQIVVQGDFLKWEPDTKYDLVVGNPPYVRYDKIERAYARWLKENYDCFQGRADLCIPFIQHSLSLISNKGQVAVICSNRFTVCNYGKRLRNLICQNFGINKMIDLTLTTPFDFPVSTYPWVFVIGNSKCQSVLFYQLGDSEINNPSFEIPRLKWRKMNPNFFSETPWHIHDAALMKRWYSVKKNNRLRLGDPEFGISVKVGIATGADEIFISPPAEAQIEQELLIPFFLSHSLKEDCIVQKTDFLLNTWDPNDPKKLIALKDWPQASKYLAENRKQLESRYIARKNPDQWYRLIDHFSPKLFEQEKLVFPSLRRSLDVYFDKGIGVPHHNCYYATKSSNTGPSLLSIGALLSSRIVDDLVSVLAIQFNGQAARLLKPSFLEIPMPEVEQVIDNQVELELTFLQNDSERIEVLSKQLYGIN